MTLKALWKTSRLMGVPRSYTHSITKPEVTWSVQGEKGKDNKIPKNPTNVLLCVIKFGNENKIHLAGYMLFGGHSSEAQCSSSREGEGKNWQNSQMTFNFWDRIDRRTRFAGWRVTANRYWAQKKYLNRVQWSCKKYRTACLPGWILRRGAISVERITLFIVVFSPIAELVWFSQLWRADYGLQSFSVPSSLTLTAARAFGDRLKALRKSSSRLYCLKQPYA